MSEMDKDLNKKKENKHKRSNKRSNRSKNKNEKKTIKNNETNKQKNEIKNTNNTSKNKRSNKRSNRSKSSQLENINKNEHLKEISNTSLNFNNENNKENIKDIDSKTKEKEVIAKPKKKTKKILIIFLIILTTLLLVVLVTSIIFKENYKKQQLLNQIKLEEEIKKHYNIYVKTNKETELYKLKKDRYLKAGTIAKEQELTLEETEVTYEDEYLKITDFDEEYYIYYEDIEPIDELSELDTRYQKYILFNKNIITKNKVNFYDEEGNLVYKFNKSFELPIIINKEDFYGVEINNRLLYVKESDIEEIDDNINTRLINTKGIAVLNYHFFYDETKSSEVADCNQIICHSKTSFTSHLEYIKNNNIFTPTMDEFEMYLNKEINLPKSVLITIDDGWRTTIATQLLEKYQLNGTIFLITSWFEEINFLNNLKYVEYHSHGDNLHNQGVCSGGQGGAIKCLDKTKLLADLALSREKLDGSTAFCYPFYEYNDYSINVLKEAGFTLAFAGGFQKATPNTDKYQIPRYVIYNNTTVSQLKNYIG